VDGFVQSGVSELDAVLGGGLNWGTTSLFIGLAGVGKTTVAAQYLCGAANPAAKAAVFLFDERLRTFVARCDALGMRASERIASGHLIPQQVEPGAGEFSHRVRRLVEEEGVRLVGIDTLQRLHQRHSDHARVCVAASAAEGWTVVLHDSVPDILIADLAMPNEDGLSFMRRTRQNSNINRRMPAIALSAFAEMRSEESARGAGFSAFLAKPASPDALIGLIDRLLTTSSTNS
jgi:CheY-like chemotaxis protein